MIKLAIVEDDFHIRESLKSYFGSQPEIELRHASDSVEALLDWLPHYTPPDILLLDVSLPGKSGIDGLTEILALAPEVSIIMLTIHDDAERVFEAFKNGAKGYLLKNTPLAKIKEGIVDIQTNGPPMSPSIARKVIEFFSAPKNKPENPHGLTPREMDVVAGLVDGFTYKEIAVRLDISVETVRHHIKNIYSKLHVNSKSQVVAKSLRGEI